MDERYVTISGRPAVTKWFFMLSLLRLLVGKSSVNIASIPDFFRRFNTDAEPFSVLTTFNTSIMKFSAMLSFT